MWPSTSISIYEKVARDESSESSASISPGLEELSLRPGNRSTSPPQGSDRNPKVWLLVGFAATTILLVIDLVLRSQALSRQVRYVETPVPEFPVQLKDFKVSSTWLEPPSPESNLRWMEEIGPGDGYIGVRQARQYNLEPGIPGVGGENFGISMFHSLHCLILIRQAWWEGLHGGENISYFRENLGSGYNLGEKHVNHCLDYVRQSIKCAADMTLEWATEEGSHRLNAMDGEVHQCRNFNEVRNYMDANLPFHAEKRNDVME